MSDLANTFLKQARSFMRAGDPQKAVELLEKAIVMSGDNRNLERQILTEMVAACTALGQVERTTRFQQQLVARFPQPQTAPALPPFPPPDARGGKKWPIAIGAALAAVVLIGGAVAVTLVVRQNQVSNGGTVSLGNPLLGPTSGPASGDVDFEDLLKPNVGLVVVVGHYEAVEPGRKVPVDFPIGTGTAFAIDSSGLLLTNKHITTVLNDDHLIPQIVQIPKGPRLVKKGTDIIVCFGAERSKHYIAKVMHESPKVDMAILKILRAFPKPLHLADKPCKQGENILVCGYPGVVADVLNKSAMTPAKWAEMLQKWEDAGHVDGLDAFTQNTFDSTVTGGRVSASRRTLTSEFGTAEYLQTDAVTTQGNSGGPVINLRGEVVGILTLGLQVPHGRSKPGAVDDDKTPSAPGSYNFALLIDQFRDELVPYLQKSGATSRTDAGASK